jgi:hypothetical protein
MPFIRIADTAKVEILGHNSQSAQPFANVLHVRLTDANQTIPHLINIWGVFDTALSGALGFWPVAAYFDAIRVTGLASATAPQYFDTLTPGTQGTQAGHAMPGVCVLSKLLTASRGKSYRGRIYWGPMASSVSSDQAGTVGSGFIADANALTSSIQTGLQALTPASNIVVASRKLGISTDIVSADAEPIVAYQRRRNGR